MASVMGNYQPENERRVGDVKKIMQPDKIIKLYALGLELVKTLETLGERD